MSNLPVKMPAIVMLLVPILALLSCGHSSVPSDRLFTELPASATGIHFENTLSESENLNPIVYQYAYNGGGVAVGDVNGDGRDDIYFTANQKENQLYINKGALRFEDVTHKAGVQGHDGWKTGVTMADVNGDGRLDIYVCYSGNQPGLKRENELFINQGNDTKGMPRFKEEAAQYGLADSSFSTAAAFFDYDRDGDLDMILVNHSPRKFDNLDDVSLNHLLNTTDSLTGVKLFRNDGGHFTLVTAQAGIKNSRLSYGLGVSIADVNGDGWPDIYLSNDFIAPDYLYINNHNGTFTDRLGSMLGETSEFSMGNDIADINNDGLPDIMTTDMLPEDNLRQKLIFTDDNYELFDLRERNGLHAQYMRNMLHLNNGDGTFSEAGRLFGVSATDWSWAPLFADFDNDGWKDLFVTNGFVHDYTNMDFEKYESDFIREKMGRIQKQDLLELVQHMPSSGMVNYIFKNDQGRSFEKMNKEWGITLPTNSNGAAYADLDGDGDLDLIVNNINGPAGIYRNEESQLLKNHYCAVQLEGSGANRFAVGAKVYVFCGGQMQYQENLMMRGFQSSVSPVLHFGLGTKTFIDSLRVIWPSGKEQVLKKLTANQRILVKESQAQQIFSQPGKAPAIWAAVPSPLPYVHHENDVNDFKRQPMMTQSFSYSGPCLAKADVNHDGREDIFVGGATGQAGKIFLQQANGQFHELSQPAFEADRNAEDVRAIFFDADGDGDPDLYVASGGYDNFLPEDPLLQDRLYINDGKGHFTRSTTALPRMFTSTGCVAAGDINGDGTPDLFVGGRVIPGRYPETPRSYVLINDGAGHFSDRTKELCPELLRPGMVTDAQFADINGDRKVDLVTVGEWMPVQIWINRQGKLKDATQEFFKDPVYGWWNQLRVEDINGDGIPDIVAGNYGENTPCKASTKEPAELVYKDFDDNGSVDPVLCFYMQDTLYPYVSKDELLDQVSMLRTRFTDYKSFADRQLKDIFSSDEMKDARTLKATSLKTACFVSSEGGRYQQRALPMEAQLSPVYAIQIMDVNGDGKKDLILAGNVSHTRIKIGRSMSNHGQLFLGDGSGFFSYVPQWRSGFNIQGEARSLLWINHTLLAGTNNGVLQAYQIVHK